MILNKTINIRPFIIFVIVFIQLLNSHFKVDKEEILLVNPYQNISWETIEQHKAALHVHTLQSDGYHMADEVIRAYYRAGFTILAITDHDKMKPNAQFERGRIDRSLYNEVATPYPKLEDRVPGNYPTNTTWPWTDFGGPTPDELGMIGIEGAEISYLHHMNSFFSSYGDGYKSSNEEMQLSAMKKMGGVVIFNHPSGAAPFWGGERRSLDWYIDIFSKYPQNFLIGMDLPGVGNNFNEGLWDQLLARFMPERPIWGFSTDDMHRLERVRLAHTIFLVDNLTEESIREAMINGEFYFVKSTKAHDLSSASVTEDNQFPIIISIKVDQNNNEINIEAENYNLIKWITAPDNLDEINDYETNNQPWDIGRTIHVGKSLNYKDLTLGNYVRAELHRTDSEGDTFIAFTNPIGIIRNN